MAEKLEFDVVVGKNTLKTTLSESAKQADQLGSTLQTALAVFGGNLITKGFDVLVGGIGSVIDIGKEAIAASAQQEVATNNLNNAMARMGNLSKQSAADMAAFASQLQATTVFEDDAALSAAALLQSLTRLNAEGLKQGVSAAADFATVLGIDLETATRLVAKAAEGQVEAFKRYGVVIQKGSTDSETFSNTIKALNAQFGGAASSQLNTFSGSLKAMKNAYGDLLEPVGDIITKNPIVISTFNAIKDTLNDTNAQVAANNEGFKGLVQDGFFAVMAGAQVMFNALDGITIAFKAIVATVQIVGDAIMSGIITPLKLVIDAFIAVGSYIPGVGDAIAGLKNPLDSASDAVNNGLIAAFDDLKNAADDNIFTAMSASTDEFTKKVIDNSAKVAEAQKNLAKNQAPPPKEEDQAIIQKRKELNADLLALDAQLAADEKLLADNIAAQKLTAGEITYQEEYARKQAEVQAVYDNELAKLDALTQAELEKAKFIKDTQEKELTEQKIKDANVLATLKLQSNKILAEEQNRQILRKSIKDKELKDQETFLSTAVTLSNSKNKELAAIGKAAAITQIAIKTPPAIASSFEFGTKLGGPPLGFAFGAIAATAMAAQAASIAGVAFENGGIVGATAGADNRVATIKDGEMILNAGQQKKLLDLINGGSVGGDIVVQVDGREIARAVRSQIQGGFSLA